MTIEKSFAVVAVACCCCAADAFVTARHAWQRLIDTSFDKSAAIATAISATTTKQ